MNWQRFIAVIRRPTDFLRRREARRLPVNPLSVQRSEEVVDGREAR